MTSHRYFQGIFVFIFLSLVFGLPLYFASLKSTIFSESHKWCTLSPPVTHWDFSGTEQNLKFEEQGSKPARGFLGVIVKGKTFHVHPLAPGPEYSFLGMEWHILVGDPVHI